MTIPTGVRTRMEAVADTADDELAIIFKVHTRISYHTNTIRRCYDHHKMVIRATYQYPFLNRIYLS